IGRPPTRSDRRGDTEPFAELAVGDESERRHEQSSEGGAAAFGDVHVRRKSWVDLAILRLEIEHCQRASADRAAKRADVLTLGKDNAQSRLAPEYPGNEPR